MGRAAIVLEASFPTITKATEKFFSSAQIADEQGDHL